MNPQFPVYVPSRGRSATRLTMKAFETMNVPYTVVVEDDEYGKYCEVIDRTKILVLDKWYQRTYEPCDVLGSTLTKGSGPARNFIWDHAISRGAGYHWVVDDNIRAFSRNNRKIRVRVGDGTIFKCMEDFCLRYQNVALGGPAYQQFRGRSAFVVNTLIYGCILIRNDVPFRWRCRYNEDLDLAIRMMKSGWCTILFRAFMQEKMRSMTMAGGNTDVLYAEGTKKKSMMIVAQHPDVCRLVYKFGRPHHTVDYAKFGHLKLVRKESVKRKKKVDNYGMTLETI
jgi:hypothetical protein